MSNQKNFTSLLLDAISFTALVALFCAATLSAVWLVNTIGQLYTDEQDNSHYMSDAHYEAQLQLMGNYRLDVNEYWQIKSNETSQRAAKLDEICRSLQHLDYEFIVIDQSYIYFYNQCLMQPRQ